MRESSSTNVVWVIHICWWLSQKNFYDAFYSEVGWKQDVGLTTFNWGRKSLKILVGTRLEGDIAARTKTVSYCLLKYDRGLELDVSHNIRALFFLIIIYLSSKMREVNFTKVEICRIIYMKNCAIFLRMNFLRYFSMFQESPVLSKIWLYLEIPTEISLSANDSPKIWVPTVRTEKWYPLKPFALLHIMSGSKLVFRKWK